MNLRWTQLQRQEMERHATEAFPEECCGFLFGVPHDAGWVLQGIRTARNLSPAPRTGFLFDGREQAKALRDADAMNLDIIGYYHSHPNGRRGPSPTDFILWGGDSECLAADERAKLPPELQDSKVPRLPDHAVQFIIAVEQGVVTDISAWRLRGDRSGFDLIKLEFVD